MDNGQWTMDNYGSLRSEYKSGAGRARHSLSIVNCQLSIKKSLRTEMIYVISARLFFAKF